MSDSAITGSQIGTEAAVTNFTFTNSNGFVGTVSTATTTPTLTLSHSGGRVLLNETVVSSSVASVSFTNLITTQYTTYILEFENLFPVTNQSYPCIQVSQDNGATWLTSYVTEAYGREGGSNTQNTRSLVYTGALMQGHVWGCPNEATKPNSPANGFVKFYNPALASATCKCFNGQLINDYYQGATYTMRNLFSAYCKTPGAVNAIRFYFDGGVQIAKGVFRLYGY